MAVKKKKLLFVDTNIWLDFYRPRQSDVAIELLGLLEGIKDKIIVTHILEMEYKSRRQRVILEGMNLLKSPQMPPTIGFLSGRRASKALDRHGEEVKKGVTKLREHLQRALKDPQNHDRVYMTCQRIFRRADPNLILSIATDGRVKRVIREKAMRRFMSGCPPRKMDDTSIGDAINWEWMVRCADREQAELVILTRDSDYGSSFGDGMLPNDYLKQEFKERVNMQGDLRVYKSASHALKHFQVAVPKKVADAEREFISSSVPSDTPTTRDTSRYGQFQDFMAKWAVEHGPPGSSGGATMAWFDEEDTSDEEAAAEFLAAQAADQFAEAQADEPEYEPTEPGFPDPPGVQEYEPDEEYDPGDQLENYEPDPDGNR